MVASESIAVMLLVEPFFKTFTPKPVIDARTGTEVVRCHSCESREALDGLVGKAVAAGARTPNPPQDHGFMYQHGYENLDGHLWGLMDLDPRPRRRLRPERGSAGQAAASAATTRVAFGIASWRRPLRARRPT